MLTLNLPKKDYDYDDLRGFYILPECCLTLEHSLNSISKWESIWKKPFLAQSEEKSFEEWCSYFECMLVEPELTDDIKKHFRSLTTAEYKLIFDYIQESQTATWFAKKNDYSIRNVTTSEVIFYYMASFGIPFECQYWHLSRLMTLIQVCSIKNAPKEKMSNDEILRSNEALNEARKRELHTTG